MEDKIIDQEAFLDDEDGVVDIDDVTCECPECEGGRRKLTKEEKAELTQRRVEESRLNKPITAKNLLKFTIPTIISFVIMSVFFTVDGIFASRGVGMMGQSAVGIVAPFFTFAMAIGFMLAVGGAALVAKKKGKKLKVEARQNFSMLTVVVIVTSLIISVVAWFIRSPLLTGILGADEFIYDYALTYIQPLIIMMPFVMIGIFLVQFLIAEGRPVLGMIASTSGAIISTGLNAVFLFGFDMGIMSLALATGIGYSVPTIIGLVYFTFFRKGTLYFVRPKWDIRALGRSALNGASELVTMMATTVTAVVMNNVLMDSLGFEAVASAGIVLGIQGIFASLFIGYSAGVAPIVSYNYGKQRDEHKRKLFKKSLIIVSVLSVSALVLTQALAGVLVLIYDTSFYGPEGYVNIYSMTVRGLRIVSLGYIIMGFNVFATAWFTAFNDGIVSGFLSLLRTMAFTVLFLLTLPIALGVTGVWIALPLAEVATIFFTVFFLVKLSKKYGYIDQSKLRFRRKVSG
ncbi:MAG: MATE family efflux transporter [Firmicutes bacterium]|nr:MATE family efflux transporter [Bacillota bacterium]